MFNKKHIAGTDLPNGHPERRVTVEELAKHDQPGDVWLAVHGRVYDITNFAAVHPGGEPVIMKSAGKDGTKLFDTAHKNLKPDKIIPGKFIGVFNNFI